MKLLVSILLLFLSYTGTAATITGTAPGYEGQRISLLHYHDYISYKLEVLAVDTIDDAGKFSFEWETHDTDLYLLRIGHTNAQLYVGTDASYEVLFPQLPPNQAYSIANVNMVELEFHNLDIVNDVNARLSDFNRCYEQFFIDHFTEIAKRQFQSELDTFKASVKDCFSSCTPDPWSDAYMKYTIGQTQQLVVDPQTFQVNRGKLFEEYLKDQPVHYTNVEYMKFVQDFFREYFPNYIMYHGDEVVGFAINDSPSYHILKKALERDEFLADARLRELVLINSLGELYHNKKFEKTNIIALLDSVATLGEFDENKAIAKAYKSELTKLSEGSPAPQFTLYDDEGNPVKLSDFAGKYVYLDFWATWCKPCISEMALMPEMVKKYHKDIEFLSISLDKKREDFDRFVEDHPKYDWNMLHFDGDQKLVMDYEIRALPSYFLIGPDGNFVQSPALRPSPNGTNKTIDMIFHQIQVELHPHKGSGVGNRENTPGGGDH